MSDFVIFAAALAYVNAGFLGAPAVATYSAAPAVSSSYFQQAAAPVAVAHAAPVVSTYATAPVAIHAPAIGSSQQSVERALGGAQSVSHYSKALDSAFSSVRKFDTRITNDALRVAHAPLALAHAAPVVSSYSTPAIAHYSAAPAIAHYSAAPAITGSYFQSSAPVAVAHSPVVSAYSAPAPVATYAAHASPVVSAYSAGPIVTKSAVAYSPASVVSHTTFTGLGASYQW
ncbi:hypothetical protein NQ314_021514 [Rhamnusium bicolor]|uniref:Uncharacterized protein n=1 Tax=Rhamnusium bicolor TaxID=1586634 RepID=A0AAV8WI55_9CUCU|nr:hypothetical protein NQ314_021514 [Rhamnusium bicolor]